MRKMFLLFGLLLACAILFVACTDEEPTSPAEPSFGKKPPSSDCVLDQRSRSEAIRVDIENLFADKRTRKAAEGQINNIERKLCKEPPQWFDAMNMAWDFLYFTNGKIPDKVIGDDPPAAAAQLTSKVFDLATDPFALEDPLEIPPEAFLVTGAVILLEDLESATPENPITGCTGNDEYCVVVDNPDAFPPGTESATIVLSRAARADVVEFGGFIPGFQAYELGYVAFSSVQLDPAGGGVIIEGCVVTDGLDPAVDARLVIGHDLGGGEAELLFPRLATNEVDCSNATAGSPPIEASASPAWLNLARRAIEPAKRLFGPKPLNAMYFGGRGLGGRTTSFSNFAFVDPWSLSVTPESATINVTGTVSLVATISVPPEEVPPVGPVFLWTSDDAGVATVDTDGLVIGVGPGTATITVTHDVLEATSEITVLLPPPFTPGTIDFDVAPDGSPVTSGTLVNDLYAPAGVTFGHGGAGTLCGTNVYANDWVVPGFPAPSLPNRISLCDEGTASDISENTYGFIAAVFGPFVSEVCLDVSTVSSHSGFMAAYSQSGALLERVTTPLGPAAATQPLCVTRGDPDIVAVTFSGDGSLFAMFDNLSFTPGPGGSNQIAFVGNPDIKLINANGTMETDVTSSLDLDRGPTWSPDGQRIAFFRLSGSGIYIINADGTGPSGPFGPTGAIWPAWSPLGNEIAFEEGGNIHVMDVLGTNVRVVTTGNQPAWSPDGTQIAYTLNQDIYTISSDGLGTPFNVTNSGQNRTPAWSPDGTQIAYTNEDGLGNDDIWVINADGSGTAENVTNNPATETQVDWSPDGSMLTFWSSRAGGDQIFIQATDGSGTATQLTFSGVNFDPVWRPPFVVAIP